MDRSALLLIVRFSVVGSGPCGDGHGGCRAGCRRRSTCCCAGRGRRCGVRGLHAQSTSLDAGIAGQRLGINIVGADVDTETVSRGDWLVAADRCQPTLRLDAEISILPSEVRPFGPRAAVHLHLGRGGYPGPDTGLGRRPDQTGGVRPGACGFTAPLYRQSAEIA